jgi:hypothetical protein
LIEHSERKLRRVDNQIAHAALSAAYATLPDDKRKLIKTEFAKHRSSNPELSWNRFLAVALPLLPAE